MPVNNIFHDHIVLSNVDKHGVKQILYPKTTTSDVVMGDDNTTLANFLNSVIRDDGSVVMKQHLKFKENGQNTRPGIMMYDNDNTEFVALVHNKTNLWIGAQSGTSGSHKGATFISTGWDPTTNTAYPTIKISVPKKDGGVNSASTYDAIHSGNIGDNSIIFNTFSRGIFLHDTKRNYAGIYNNGDNLWIGASSSTAYHHLGKTYISAGFRYDPNSSYNGYVEKEIDGSYYCIGNNTVYVSIPLAQDGSWTYDPDDSNINVTSTNYAVLHEGVVTDILSNNNLDLSNRYVGHHLSGHLSGSMLDSVLTHRTPIKNLTNMGGETPYVDITPTDEYDINPADKYGRIKITTVREPVGSSSYVKLSFNYDTSYYRYDVFTMEIYGLDISYFDDWTKSAIVTLTDNNNTTREGILHITNEEDLLADCIKFEAMPLASDVEVGDVIPSTAKYIKHVEISFSLKDLPVNRSFYLQTYAGNSIKGISHLRSYNHMLVDILARLYKLENPST